MLHRILTATLCTLFFTGALSVGSWSEWSDWTSCSVSCGTGARRRYRACDPALTLRTDAGFCEGQYLETEACERGVACPAFLVDGGWGQWSPWSKCSATCGEGCMERYRGCNQPIPLNGGRPCQGPPQEKQPCFALRTCPRDGGWSSWSSWSTCSVTCGRGGSLHRYRSCNNPPPAEEGKPCEEKAHEERPCTASIKCPVNGQWSEWSPWTHCSVSCGDGERMRRRACDNPPPQFEGLDCNRTSAGELQIHSCTGPVEHCPVDGEWSEWGDWGPCHSSDCLTQTIPAQSLRQRSCSNPLPAHHGLMCQGTFLEAGLCEGPLNCRVDGGWSEWSAWNCTKFVASRRKSCDNPPPANGGRMCKGENVQFFVKDEDLESYREACPGVPTDDEDLEGVASGGGWGSGDDVRE